MVDSLAADTALYSAGLGLVALYATLFQSVDKKTFKVIYDYHRTVWLPNTFVERMHYLND